MCGGGCYLLSIIPSGVVSNLCKSINLAFPDSNVATAEGHTNKTVVGEAIQKLHASLSAEAKMLLRYFNRCPEVATKLQQLLAEHEQPGNSVTISSTEERCSSLLSVLKRADCLPQKDAEEQKRWILDEVDVDDLNSVGEISPFLLLEDDADYLRPPLETYDPLLPPEFWWFPVIPSESEHHIPYNAYCENVVFLSAKSNSKSEQADEGGDKDNAKKRGADSAKSPSAEITQPLFPDEPSAQRFIQWNKGERPAQALHLVRSPYFDREQHDVPFLIRVVQNGQELIAKMFYISRDMCELIFMKKSLEQQYTPEAVAQLEEQVQQKIKDKQYTVYNFDEHFVELHLSIQNFMDKHVLPEINKALETRHGFRESLFEKGWNLLQVARGHMNSLIRSHHVEFCQSAK